MRKVQVCWHTAHFGRGKQQAAGRIMLFHNAPLPTGALVEPVLLALGSRQLGKPHAVILTDVLLKALRLLT